MSRKVDLTAWVVGLVSGVLLEGRFVRSVVRPGTSAAEVPTLAGLRESSVTCPDGVVLAVRETGPPSAAVTVVFVHGYTVTAECWAAQAGDLAAADPQLRMVLYDQRGHGASTVGPVENDTIEQLGRDLAEVLRQRTPDGRAVLVGHSMGGMTIMALAEARPELFGAKVAAVALIGTSSGGIGEVSFGLPAALAGPAAPGAAVRVPYRPVGPQGRAVAGRRFRPHPADQCQDRVRPRRLRAGPGRDVDDAGTDAPGDDGGLPANLRHASADAGAGSVEADPRACARREQDKMTPLSHSRLIARELPDAELIVVPGAGHMVIMEEPHVVSAALAELIERVS